MKLSIKNDLWQYLANTSKPVVLYGMGNGADKILSVCDRFKIPVADFFASDEFVRGHQFHGKTVLRYSDIREKYGDGHFIVLVSFATQLPEVMERIRRINAENELYIPDVPVFGDELFDLSFYQAHQEELQAAYNLLADDKSKEIYEAIVSYRLTGTLADLERSVCSPDEVYTNILRPDRYRTYADLGAYNGDTVREVLSRATGLHTVYAMEPDTRSFRKLSAYAETETRCRVLPVHACAWDRRDTLCFDASGNRNANVSDYAVKTVREVVALPLDEVLSGNKVDYIKYDVEGSEYRALCGSADCIRAFHPDLCISLYHRSVDLFSLPLFLNTMVAGYKVYLRRFAYYPAWDLNLYAIFNE